MNKPTALYHFTDKSEKRPIIYQKQIEELKQYAASVGLNIDDDGIYVDKTLLKCDHVEFQRFLSHCEEYSHLVTKDFYHIAKNTNECFFTLRDLHNKGVRILTMENGAYIPDNPPFDIPLQIATYDFISANTMKKNEIASVNEERFQVFAELKTNWKIIDSYRDICPSQNNGEQKELARLTKNHNKYDLIMVLNFADLHNHTARFCHKRSAIGLDIYSITGGYFKYTEVKNK